MPDQVREILLILKNPVNPVQLLSIRVSACAAGRLAEGGLTEAEQGGREQPQQ